MRQLWRLAWRNIWRNPRRTLLTAASVALAVMIALLMRSMQEGSYAHMLANSARFFSGYVQIQHPEFWDNKSINQLLPWRPEWAQALREQDTIQAVLPRLETFMLAASGDKTRGAAVFGIDMAAENAYADLRALLRDGDLPPAHSRSALLGSRLAHYLRLQPGDELILYGQGYHGNTAAERVKVAGVLKHPSPQLDARLVYLPLRFAQDMLVTGPQVSAYLINPPYPAQVEPLAARLRPLAAQTFNLPTVVKTWQELTPELVQQIVLDRVSGQLLLAVLYGIVGFGLFATVTLMTLERQRELAILLANGMNRWRVQTLLLLEGLWIGLLGCALGLALMLPVLAYLHRHPIPLSGEIKQMMEELGLEPVLPFAFQADLICHQPLVVLLLLLLCLQYPLWRVRRLKLAEALQG